MKDLGLNAGFISWWDRKGKDDAHVLKILWKAGCVFYARTTQPQSLMHLETSSNLYGVTVNPFNRNLTCGGSSGGEGALLGMRGSCLGLGSDIGGSVRSPAANCGIYSLRPSSYRIPVEGWESTMLGQGMAVDSLRRPSTLANRSHEEQIVAIVGPMSTSLEGIKLFMKTVIDAKPWLTEPSLVPIPWRYRKPSEKTVAEKKLKVGVIWHDGVVKPHPPITRALHEVVQKLRKVEGVSVVDWKPHNHDEACKNSPAPSNQSTISLLYRADSINALLPRRRRRRSLRHRRLRGTVAPTLKLDPQRKPKRQTPLRRRNLVLDPQTRGLPLRLRRHLEQDRHRHQRERGSGRHGRRAPLPCWPQRGAAAEHE